MTGSGLVACLDIGRSLMHFMVGRFEQPGHSLRVCRVHLAESQGMRNGSLFDPWQLTEGIRHAVETIEAELEESIGGFYLCVDAESSALVKLQSSVAFDDSSHVISEDDVQRLLHTLRTSPSVTASSTIDIFGVMYNLGGNGVPCQDPRGLRSRVLEAHGYMLQRRNETLLQYLRCLKYARIRVRGLVHPGLAVGEEYLTEEQRREGALILDLGYEGCKLYYFFDGHMQAQVYLPIGGRTFCRDIEVVLNCKVTDAQQLKYAFGFGSSDEEKATLGEAPQQHVVEYHGDEDGEPLASLVPRILQARMDQLLGLAEEAFQREGLTVRRCPLGLMGGEALTLGIERYLSRAWSGEVHLIHPEVFQVPLPIFTGTYAMLHSLQRLGFVDEESDIPSG